MYNNEKFRKMILFLISVKKKEDSCQFSDNFIIVDSRIFRYNKSDKLMKPNPG